MNGLWDQEYCSLDYASVGNVHSAGLDDRFHYTTLNCQTMNLLKQKGLLIQNEFTALSYVRQSWDEEATQQKTVS